MNEDELAPLLHTTNSPSSNLRRLSKHSLIILYLTSFIGATGYSMVISSALPYLQSIDHTISLSFYGWVVGAFSIGQLLFSPVLGYLTNKFGYRFPYCLSVTIIGLSNILYAYAYVFPVTFAGINHIPGYVLICARFFIGVGSSNVAIARSYISDTIPINERTKYLGFIAAAQSTGFLLGPVLQLMFVGLGHEGYFIPIINFQLNMYTAPAMFSVYICLINLLALMIAFVDFSKHVNREDDSPTIDVISSSPIDFTAVVLSNILWFVNLTAISFFEGILTALLQAEYAWNHQKVITVGSVLGGAIALTAFFVFLSISFLAKRFKERHLLTCALLITAIGYFVCYPISNSYPPEKPVNATSPQTAVGCDTSQYSWCHSVHTIYFFQFVISGTITMLAYSANVVLVTTLYSKILGPCQQGVYQGFLTTSGSTARFLAPIVITAVFAKFGPLVAFFTMGTLFSLTTVLQVIFSSKFVPRLL